MSSVDVTVVSIAAGVVVAVAATVAVADKLFRRSFYQFPMSPFPSLREEMIKHTNEKPSQT